MRKRTFSRRSRSRRRVSTTASPSCPGGDRLLLDQGLPYSAAHRLRAAGHDAVHVSDLGMSTASDVAILARARADGRVVVTLDADFHALLALSGAPAPSVIRIRDEKLRGDAVAEVVLQVLEMGAAELDVGAVVTVRQGVARWRGLPI